MIALIKNKSAGVRNKTSCEQVLHDAESVRAPKEIHSMYDAGILKKPHWYDDIPWAAASFFQMKKTNDFRNYHGISENVRKQIGISLSTFA